MNIEILVIFGLLGAALGFFIPYFTKTICKYKTCKENGETEADEPSRPGWQTPFLGILNATVWVLAGGGTGRWFPAFLLSVQFSLSVLIALIDLKIRIIPNELVLVMLALGLGYHLSDSGFSALPGAALSLVGMMVLFSAAAAFVGFGKVGAGDVKLAGAMGFALGYPGIVNALLFMCAALVVYIGAGLATRRLTMRTMLPFAPFMMLAMAVKIVLQVVYPQLVLFT